MRSHRRSQALLVGILGLALLPSCKADTIWIEGTMSLVWQYDLSTNAFNSVVPVTIPVSLAISDEVTGQIDFGGGTVRTLFGPVHISSTLFDLLGYSSIGITSGNSGGSAQGNNGTWNATWLTFSEELAGPSYSEARWISFDAPAMPDPYTYGPADLKNDLIFRAGQPWGMRNDGAGLQNLLQGTISSVWVETPGVPEPGSIMLLALGLTATMIRVRYRAQS